MMRLAVLVAVFALQGICALFFVSDIILSVLGIYVPPLSWESREILEISAALGLLLGLGLGGVLILRALRESRQARERLRRAATAFNELLEERFGEWGLTPAEREVALFAIKGLSTPDIARLRATSEGTVKAQTAAIYRKAGVNGRGQLLSLFIEDMMHEEPLGAAPASGASGAA